MTFLFFDAADAPLFSRNDAESANWTVEERSLQLLFPFKAGKEITRGMRVGFFDETGVFQPFEVRKVRNYEPDHYQEITAEHIVIAELTDDHYAGSEQTNVTAEAALTALLTGTLWSVGNVTASNTSSANLALGSVYQSLRTIETNWNVYITPRVTLGASGITGRYLDIAPAEGVWRGVRLSIDKNADEMGVTVDDTETLTALYGYGKATDGVPLNFGSVVWTATSDHPAKPSGQTYIEDPAATAAYGRNGRARFGYYQNSDISNATILLQKTWEALKATMQPRVTVDSMVRDLYRLGYADQPIRLHDTAIVDIRPTNTSLKLEIIRLSVDLLDPTATRPTIGAYIPNIVYINRETAVRASGGGGGGASGRRGGGTKAEDVISEFETEIAANQYEISLRAYQRDMTNVENILRAAGISVNAQGVAIYADDYAYNIGSKINVEANRISLVVTDDSNPTIKAASIVTAINSSGSSVTIDADKIYLNGEAIANAISANSASIANLENGTTQASVLSTVMLLVDSSIAQWCNVVKTGYTSATSVSFLGNDNLNLEHYHTITATEGTGADAGKILITLGAPQSSAGSTNFNIAATQFYIDGVAAAQAAGASSVTLSGPSWGSSGGTSNSFTVTASNGAYKTEWCYLTRSSWNNGAADVHLRSGTATGTVRATNTVDIGSASNWQISYNAQGETVSVTVAGKTFTHTFTS